MNREMTVYAPSDREVGFISASPIADMIVRWKGQDSVIRKIERDNGIHARSVSGGNKNALKAEKTRLAEASGLPSMRDTRTKLSQEIFDHITVFMEEVKTRNVVGGRVVAVTHTKGAESVLDKIVRVYPIGEEKTIKVKKDGKVIKQKRTEIHEGKFLNAKDIQKLAMRNPGLFLGQYILGNLEGVRDEELQEVFDHLKMRYLPQELMKAFPKDFVPQIKKGEEMIMGREYGPENTKYHYGMGLPGGRVAFVTRTIYPWADKRKDTIELEGVIGNPFAPEQREYYLNPESAGNLFSDPTEEEREYLKTNKGNVDISRFEKKDNY